MTKTERIVMLLEWYVDVEAQGMRDGRSSDGEHLPLMSRAWNHPSYRELDRLLDLMRREQRHLYWHLSQTYLYSTKRRVLECPRCRSVVPSWYSGGYFHKHGNSNVAIVPKVVSVIHKDVRSNHVGRAIAWLEEQWIGEPFLPDELLAA